MFKNAIDQSELSSKLFLLIIHEWIDIGDRATSGKISIFILLKSSLGCLNTCVNKVYCLLKNTTTVKILKTIGCKSNFATACNEFRVNKEYVDSYLG